MNTITIKLKYFLNEKDFMIDCHKSNYNLIEVDFPGILILNLN